MLWWTLRQLRSKNPKIRTNAAEKLKAAKDPGVLKPMIPLLQHANPDVRVVAAELLGDLADRRAVEPLIASLRDVNADVRIAAAMALDAIHDARALVPLISAFDTALAGKDPMDPIVELAMFEALEHIDPGWTKRQEAIGLVPTLLAALRDGNYHAARRLGEIGDARAVEPLIKALGDREWLAQKAAAQALGKFCDARTVELLIKALEDPDVHVQKAAAVALDRIDPKWRDAATPAAATQQAPQPLEIGAEACSQEHPPLGPLDGKPERR